MYCETELKKQVFEAYDNKVRIEHQGGDRWTTVVQTFNQLWGSTHEWTVRALVYKGVYDRENEAIEDLYPHALPPAKGKGKWKKPRKNKELCRSEFADWVFRHLDQDLTFHVPPYS